MKDMIDVRKLMNSKPELVIPRKVYISSASIRNVILSPIFISLFEYVCIFLLAGLVIILPSSSNDLASNWSNTAGTIFSLIYLSFWAVDMVIFISLRTKLFYYTFLTLVGRIVSGILLCVFLYTKVAAIFLWTFFFLTITLVVAILKGLNDESMTFVYHCINIFVMIIGSILVNLASSKGEGYYSFMQAVVVFLY